MKKSSKKSFTLLTTLIISASLVSPVLAGYNRVEASSGAQTVIGEVEQLELETYSKEIIEVDGYAFKDLNDNGELDEYEDWRLDDESRAEDLVSQMTIEEKAGNMLINSLSMGLAEDDGENILADNTEELIENQNMRHFILRQSESARDTAEWINEVNKVAENTRLGIPVIITSNSRNENDEDKVNLDLDTYPHAVYPGTLGIAAATKGDLAQGGDYSLIADFSANSRQEWTAQGIRKGYMYMADTLTDPRWQRTYGTFGEDPEFISDIFEILVPGYQGVQLGDDSVALTVKHFPGGGARENGFDPHYEEGKWNVYPTAGSLEKYHLPPFEAAIKHQPSSIMPYYSAPSREKSVEQYYNGEPIPFEEVGMAFNEYMLEDLLRDQLGFEGYVNSDTGIISRMAWGPKVEEMTEPERFAYAINAGTDLISGSDDIEGILIAYDHGLISDERLDEANQRLLEEMFALGLFDDKTYVDLDEAEALTSDPSFDELAYEAHQKSVTLLKNSNDVLPLEAGTAVYIDVFHKDPEQAEVFKERALEAAAIKDVTVVENREEADAAVLFVRPESGDYFNATDGYLELSLVEDKEKTSLKDGSTYHETTVSNMDGFNEITSEFREAGKPVVTSVNFTMSWILENVEPQSDALLASFDTFEEAQFDVIFGHYNPTGRLPMTLPASEEVVAVDENGISVSPNDVPGYDKDKYMPEGMTYAYEDSEGNVYGLDYGLSFSAPKIAEFVPTITLDLNKGNGKLKNPKTYIENMNEMPGGFEIYYINLDDIDLSGETTEQQLVELRIDFADGTSETHSVPLEVIPEE